MSCKYKKIYGSYLLKVKPNISNISFQIGVLAGLFHGGKALCERQKITERPVEDNNFTINETLTFNIQVCNIPKSAKLCFVLYEVNRSTKTMRTRKSKESMNRDYMLNPIAWVNTTVYDFRNQLKRDAASLYMWNNAEDTGTLSDDIFHSLGTVVSNPDTRSATTLTLTFDRY